MKDYTDLIKQLRDHHRAMIVTGNPKAGQYLADAADAIELLRDKYYKAETDATNLTGKLAQAEADVERLKPKQRKLGRWEKAKPKGVVVYSDGYAECSHCHETIWLGWWMNFCPHCGTQNKIIDPDDYDGAKMEVQE